MSDLLASVKRSFFHDVLGCQEAESRLKGREGAYLFRESDVKSGLFIMCRRQILEDAVDIAADVIACSDSYCHPVPSSPGDAASQCSGCDSRSDKSRCYCCSLMCVKAVNYSFEH